jgi:hypothetical protein
MAREGRDDVARVSRGGGRIRLEQQGRAHEFEIG